MKSWIRIRIKVMRIRNPGFLSMIWFEKKLIRIRQVCRIQARICKHANAGFFSLQHVPVGETQPRPLQRSRVLAASSLQGTGPYNPYKCSTVANTIAYI